MTGGVPQGGGWAWRCDRCPDVSELRALTVKGLLCARCYKAMGQPAGRAVSMGETHEAEVRTRAVMTRRGGADAHIVRKGLS